MKIYRAIIIVRPHGTLIANGQKIWIVKSVNFRNISHKPLLLVENKRALGIIWLGDSFEISISKFKKTYKKHLISEKERKKWWTGHKKLYVFPVQKIQIFSKPRRVDYPAGTQTFVKPEHLHRKM